MIEAHKKDGLALTRFIYWIKNVNKKKITEVYAQNKLEKFRKLNKDYLFPSFDTIAGAGSNGAIVHYRANKKITKKIEQSDIFIGRFWWAISLRYYRCNKDYIILKTKQIYQKYLYKRIKRPYCSCLNKLE